MFSSLNFRPYPSHTLIHKKDNNLFQATPKYPGLLANFKSSKLTEKKEICYFAIVMFNQIMLFPLFPKC